MLPALTLAFISMKRKPARFLSHYRSVAGHPLQRIDPILRDGGPNQLSCPPFQSASRILGYFRQWLVDLGQLITVPLI